MHEPVENLCYVCVRVQRSPALIPSPFHFVCVCARSADHRRTIASLIRGHWPQLVLRHYSLRDSLTSARVIASFRIGMFAKTRVHLVLVLLVAVASLSLASKHNKDKYDKPTAQPVATAEAIAELLASADNQSATSASVYYDQRQTGKYNINVNIKDVAIISIDPESLAGNVGVSGVWLFNGVQINCKTSILLSGGLRIIFAESMLPSHIV